MNLVNETPRRESDDLEVKGHTGVKSGKPQGSQRPGFIEKLKVCRFGERGRSGIPGGGRYGRVVRSGESRGSPSQERGGGLRRSWGFTPARNCSQRQRSPAAGRTPRSEGGVGAVQASLWDKLKRECVLGGPVRGCPFQEAERWGYRLSVSNRRPHPSPGPAPEAWFHPSPAIQPTWSHYTGSIEGRLEL